MNNEQYNHKIDQLASKVTDGPGLPFKEDAWHKMELLLDKEEKKRRFVIWWFWLPLLVLLAGLGSYRFIFSNNKTAASIEDSILNKKLVKRPSTNNNSKETSKDKKSTAPTAGQTRGKTIASTNDVHVAENKTKERQQSFSIKSKQAVVGSQTLSAKKSAVKNRKQAAPQTVTEDSHNSYGTARQEQNAVIVTTVKLNKGELALIDLKLSARQPMFGLPSTLTDTLKQTAGNKKTKEPKQSRLEFFVLGSADLTAVSFKQVKQISTGYGVGAAFHLSKKWSISTAFSVSEKLYKGDTNSYKSPINLGNRYTLTDIDAKCRVFDISLNAQYAFKQGKRGSWFGVAGLSTYIMNQEDYDYTYDYLNMPYKYAYNYSNENQHYFSIFNLAVAYRSKLGKNLAWQLSPFVKIPLTGIGYGKVNLYSAGLQASIHFRKQ